MINTISFKNTEFAFQRSDNVQELLHFNHALRKRRELTLECVCLRDHVVLEPHLGAHGLF